MKQTEIDWNDYTLYIDDSGHVQGQAWYGPFYDGYDVSVTVHSYDYDQYDETHTNHVPHVSLPLSMVVSLQNHTHTTVNMLIGHSKTRYHLGKT